MKNVEYCTVNNEDQGTVEVPKICTHGLNVATIRAFIHVFGTWDISISVTDCRSEHF